MAMMHEISQLAADLRLRVAIRDDEQLVTETPSSLTTPSWAFNVTLQGNRECSRIFRLPNKGGWIQKWLYSRGAEAELVPENALVNSTAESTTIFRASPMTAQAFPMMSSHWFLCPYQSCNGYTVGLAYMDVTLDNLDRFSVHPANCGRFAMDEASGEVFLTAWHDRSFMTVGWTESVSSCERVREIFLFEAPRADGLPPGRALLRNSFYERRDCRLCGGGTIPPCRAPAARAHRVSRSGTSDYLFPLQTTYRRFRGCYYGVVEKTVYTRTGSKVVASVPIVCDIRHGVASVARRLRINLRQTAVSFGVDPRVSARMLVVNATRAITARFAPSEGESDASGNASSESSVCSSHRGPGEAKRRRNADNVHDRDSIVHKRKVRNRESAARTNEARKRRILETKTQLENLKTNIVPALQTRLADLQRENIRLKECVDAEQSMPHQSIETLADVPMTSVSLEHANTVFNDDLFFPS